MDRAFQPSRKYPRRPAKSGLVDGFAEENAIFGGYNQSAASASAEPASGNLRLLDNFTLYVQTDEEGSEELVDLQDLSTDGVHGLPLKATGTVLDHRLCSQQSVYDARGSSKIKVRIHYIRDWVVDYSTPVTVWLITDWAWYRLLSPSRIYKQQYQSIANKTRLVAACLQIVSSNASLSYDAVVRHLADGVAVLPQGADPEAPEYISDFDGHDTAEVQRFGQHELLDHAAFVVQQVGPVLGRHALKSFLVTLADRADLQLREFIGTGRKLTLPSEQSVAADVRRRPAPQTSFLVPQEAVPSLLLVWDFCQRYAALLRLPPFPFLRLQLACMDMPPPLQGGDVYLTPSPTQHTSQPERSPTSCKECDASFPSTKALREHCSLSGHDPTRAPKSSKQKLSSASVQPAVPLELSVVPVPDQVEMERWGPTGQGRLLCDIHSALIRVLEGLDEDLMEAPTMAGYGSAVDLTPQDAFRPLLGASWPELARRYLQEHGPLTVSQDAVEAVLRLKVTEYNQLSVHDRALILEGLVTIVANTELLRNHLRHLEPEGATPVLNRGAVMGQDSAGNIYHQLGGPSARGSLYVEAAEGQAWGWYSPHQIPSLIAWLEAGSQQEQQLAEELYTMYQPVLRLVAQPSQASASDLPQLQELWQPSAPSRHHLIVSPEALQQPRDGYKGSQPVIHPSQPLQHELLRLLATAPFWNKDLEWMQSRAAVQSLLPRTTTGPEFARLLWLTEELLYEDLLKGSGWGRRRGWFREQLEATRNVAQAAALGGQLAAHCRREGDLGLVTPQELLQSAQRQRCYLGYIPQPPQDVVLFKSGYEAHVRQQERSVPAIPAWLESWAPMQDCKVKQMACVVEHIPASQRQASLRSQNQPGFPPRVIEPPCTAWLLLEKEPSLPQQASSDEADEEIDWTHFTFQHGFRQLPQQLAHQLHFGPPSLSAPPTQDIEMSEASPSPSLSGFATLPVKTFQESGLTPESEDIPQVGFAGAGVDGEREGNEGDDLDDETAEGQRLTRSRRGNAAGLYMLDHGSQLVPKKIRQARPTQRPARLLNNALEDGGSMNLNEADRAPALLAAPAMLPGEDRIRFWMKERSLLAVALHVKPGMTRAAEFLVPVQLCNRALSVAWPLGMPVKMPFTGTVLDHLTKPRPDTRFCTGVLRQTLSAVRSAIMAPPLGAGVGVGVAMHDADPWNALDVSWDSDTPPGWPKMVCPWQVMEDRGGELRKAKERYRQAEAEKREKARQENLVREANRRATAERQQQAAAALQAERMRRALEARAVVAQVAEQKEADRAALAAVQGGAGQNVTGPQLLASVVPRSTAGGAVSSVGLPSAPAASAAAAGLSVNSAYSQQMMQQLQGGAVAHQLRPQAQYPAQPAAGLQSHALHPASHAMVAAPSAQHHSSYQYPQAYAHPQMGRSGTHAGQMGAMDSVQDTAWLQVQAALTDPSKASLNMPAQQISAALQQGSRPQAEASQGVGAAGAIASAGAGLLGVAPAAVSSGQQHTSGVLSAAGGSASGEGTPAGGTPGSSPAETENSALGKRARSGDADEQSSPPRAKKVKPAAEGYRERWLAGKPRAQSKTWCSMLCCVCEQGSDDFELLVCKGPCLRAFHPACLGMTPQAVISPASQAAWFCPECLHGRVRCFVCGDFGAGFEDPTVRKCSLGVCGRFYHIKCAQALELTQMAKKGAHFRCPQHYCAVCQKSGDGVDMVKCIRCPTAYHSSCMPKDIQRLLPHAKVVLCSNHVDQPLGPYQHPPAPDPNKLEAAQQQGKAMGLPPVKAKSGHASGSGTGFGSPDQRQSGSQQADIPQESVSGQRASLTNLAAAGETAPVGAASIQPSQYSDNTQGEQQAFLQAAPSAPGSLPPLQQLQTRPGLPSTATIPAVTQMTNHVPLTVSQQQQQQQQALTAGTGQPGQQDASATPFGVASLQGIPAGSLLGGGPGPPMAQAGLIPAHVHGLAQQHLLQPSSQSLSVSGMQPMGSGQFSHQSSEPLSHQSSAPLSHHGSGQLPMQLQQQLPHAVSGQMLDQAQATASSSLQQRAGLPNQAMPSGIPLQAGMLNIQQQQQQQQQQQISNGNQTHTDSVRVNTDGLDGFVSPLGSPTIGLKLGQIHSPGLSEDALGGDQEFMDAMQAMSDGAQMK
ncbi:hypothetical protein WJX82_010406 [Trebouxia sp. C0006]